MIPSTHATNGVPAADATDGVDRVHAPTAAPAAGATVGAPDAASGGPDLRATCERIAQLLAEIPASTSGPVRRRVETLVRALLDLYGAGLARIVAIAAASDDVRRRLADDELVAALLVLHGLHPDDVATRVGRAVTKVRPYLGSHGGDVEIVAIDAACGVVELRMTGSCDGCPSSLLTVKLAIETAVKELAPEIARVEVAGVTERPAARHPTSAGWVELAGIATLPPGALAARDVDGAAVVLCRVGAELYAYDDHCASCGGSVAAGRLDDAVLACPGCGHRFDVRRAGRGLDDGGAHLVPVPLLEHAAGVRVARAGAHA